MFLYVITILLVLFSLLSFRYVKKISIQNWISKDCGDTLKGISMLVIFLHHMVCYSKKGSIFYLIFGNIGFLGSSIFLFVSGYGLMYSYKNKKDYLKKFLINRVLNIYVVFSLIGGILYKLNDLTHIYNIFIRKDWFIEIILYYYVVFYLIFKYINKENIRLIFIYVSCALYIITCITLKVPAYWYNTAICFPIGITCMEFKKFLFDKSNKYYCLTTIILLLIFILFIFLNVTGIISNLRFLQFIVPLIFIMLVCMVLIKFNIKSNFFRFISSISLEIYLLHKSIVKCVINKLDFINNDSLGVLIGLIITIILSYLISKLIKVMMDFVKNGINKYSM